MFIAKWLTSLQKRHKKCHNMKCQQIWVVGTSVPPLWCQDVRLGLSSHRMEEGRIDPAQWGFTQFTSAVQKFCWCIPNNNFINFFTQTFLVISSLEKYHLPCSIHCQIYSTTCAAWLWSYAKIFKELITTSKFICPLNFPLKSTADWNTTLKCCPVISQGF